MVSFKPHPESLMAMVSTSRYVLIAVNTKLSPVPLDGGRQAENKNELKGCIYQCRSTLSSRMTTIY